MPMWRKPMGLPAKKCNKENEGTKKTRHGIERNAGAGFLYRKHVLPEREMIDGRQERAAGQVPGIISIIRGEAGFSWGQMSSPASDSVRSVSGVMRSRRQGKRPEKRG